MFIWAQGAETPGVEYKRATWGTCSNGDTFLTDSSCGSIAMLVCQKNT
jgi:hypothetical protein